jgi:hypothetical protein
MCIVRPVSLTSGVLHGKETQEAQLQDLDTGRSERAEKALSREDASGQDREGCRAMAIHIGLGTSANAACERPLLVGSTLRVALTDKRKPAINS